MTNWHIRGAMLLLVVLIALRPGIGEAGEEEKPRGGDLEILFVVDETVSMSALDHQGVRSRLEGVRDDLSDIVSALPNAQFALVTFGHAAEVVLPFTSDPDAMLPAIAELTREPLLAGTGSSVDRPLPVIRRILTRAEEQHPDRTRVIVFASDGENTLAGHRQKSFAPLADFVDAGAVLGYGSPSGGLMPSGAEPPWTFVRDLRTGDDAVSRIDEQNLQRIAGQIGVEYAHRATSGGLDDWARGLAGNDDDPEGDGTAKYELYWILALLLVVLAAVEVRLGWLGFAQARRMAGR